MPLTAETIQRHFQRGNPGDIEQSLAADRYERDPDCALEQVKRGSFQEEGLQ